jgi:transmembrane sensor
MPGRVPQPRSLGHGGKLAVAAMAATLAIAAWSVLWWRGAIGGAVYTAGPGELRSLKLEDGSEISLTSGTRLRVDFDADMREIVLTSGEALFHVAKDAQRPFIVRAGRTTARAVGTAFSVQREAQQVVVMVGEGRVAVSQAEVVLPFRGTPAADEGVSLTADQQIATSPDGRLEQVRFVDSQRALAWAKGDLIFENETVDAIVARFNRFARVKMRVDDRRIGSRTVSGIFEVNDPESFVAFLSSVEQVTIARPRPDEIVIGRAGSADLAQDQLR